MSVTKTARLQQLRMTRTHRRWDEVREEKEYREKFYFVAFRSLGRGYQSCGLVASLFQARLSLLSPCHHPGCRDHVCVLFTRYNVAPYLRQEDNEVGIGPAKLVSSRGEGRAAHPTQEPRGRPPAARPSNANERRQPNPEARWGLGPRQQWVASQQS